MRLDGKEDCKISKISFVSFTFRATIYPLWREIRKNVTQIHTKTIDKHLHEPFDHTVKCGLFSDFQYGFRSSRATADRLAVVSNRIARAFSRSLATRTVALDMPKAFNRVWHVGLLHKLKSYGTSGQIFGLVSFFFFFDNKRLRVVLDRKSSQEYPDNAGVPQGSILGPSLLLLYIQWPSWLCYL